MFLQCVDPWCGSRTTEASTASSHPLCIIEAQKSQIPSFLMEKWMWNMAASSYVVNETMCGRSSAATSCQQTAPWTCFHNLLKVLFITTEHWCILIIIILNYVRSIWEVVTRSFNHVRHDFFCWSVCLFVSRIMQKLRAHFQDASEERVGRHHTFHHEIQTLTSQEVFCVVAGANWGDDDGVEEDSGKDAATSSCKHTEIQQVCTHISQCEHTTTHTHTVNNQWLIAITWTRRAAAIRHTQTIAAANQTLLTDFE